MLSHITPKPITEGLLSARFECLPENDSLRKTFHKIRKGRPDPMPASLNTLWKSLLWFRFLRLLWVRWTRGTVIQSQPRAYLPAAAFFFGWRSGSGSRACGFRAASSTGVVPLTSELNVAPAGTR